MIKRQWDLYSISAARNVLFGLSTLIILFFHSSILIPESLPVLNFIQETGNIGVDIFLFLSAVGLYFSFSKKECVADFYKRRMLRILPPLLLFTIIWFAFEGTVGLKAYLSNVFMLSFITQGTRIVWFFALLLVLYMLYPLIYHAIKKWDWIAAVLMLAAVVIANIFFARYCPTGYDHIEIATTRIPVFLCGAFLADKIKNHKKISCIWLLISAAAALFLLVMIYRHPNPFGCYTTICYAYCPLTIALVFLLSAFFSRFRIPFLSAFFIWIGGYSLEVYLLHEKLLIKFGHCISSTDQYQLIMNLVIAVISVLGAMLLKSICERLVRELHQSGKSLT